MTGKTVSFRKPRSIAASPERPAQVESKPEPGEKKSSRISRTTSTTAVPQNKELSRWEETFQTSSETRTSRGSYRIMMHHLHSSSVMLLGGNINTCGTRILEA